MNLNECTYNTGGKHSVCTHQYYCIFNNRVMKLESKITELWKQYNELKTLLNSYIMGYYCPYEYDVLIKRFNIVKESLTQLLEFRTKILKKRLDGYGYEILESAEI